MIKFHSRPCGGTSGYYSLFYADTEYMVGDNVSGTDKPRTHLPTLLEHINRLNTPTLLIAGILALTLSFLMLGLVGLYFQAQVITRARGASL